MATNRDLESACDRWSRRMAVVMGALAALVAWRILA